jgi:DNA-binding CsgD family transcriptional regulator
LQRWSGDVFCRCLVAKDETTLLHAAFRRAPDAILVVAGDGSYLHCNRSAADLLATRETRITQHRFGDFSRGAMRLRTNEWWSQLERAGLLAIRHVLTDLNGCEHIVETRGCADVLPGMHLLIVRPVPQARDCTRVLTPREREVLGFLAHGLTTEQVAGELFLSPLTIRSHVRNAMQKLGAQTRTHAVALALREGEIDP